MSAETLPSTRGGGRDTLAAPAADQQIHVLLFGESA